MGFASQFALQTDSLQIYDVQRYDPLFSYPDSRNQMIQFSRTESSLLGAINEITCKIYDTRMQTVALSFQTLARQTLIQFNPYEPHQLFVACEDAFAYSFDLRKTEKALDRYGGYPYAITAMDVSPDGRRLCLGTIEGTL